MKRLVPFFTFLWGGVVASSWWGAAVFAGKDASKGLWGLPVFLSGVTIVLATIWVICNWED